MSDDESPTVRDFMAGMPALEEVTARAGAPLPAETPVAAIADVIGALRSVYDPEIPVNIYDLGLIYRHDIDDAGRVAIEMTLTAPGCPVADEIPPEVAEAVAAVDGVGEVEVRLIWEPPWTQEMMSEAAKLELGMF